MAKEQQPEKVSFLGKIKQIWAVVGYTAKKDRLFLPLVLLAILVPLAAGIVVGLTVGTWMWLIAAVPVAFLAAIIVLNLRSNTAMMNEAEGQLGAAAQILEMMRGDWRVTPAVQLTTQNDFVHRVLGRPGVILVAEGSPGRVKSLLAQEKKKLARVSGDTPIYDYIVGSDEGTLSIRKLRSTLMRLPRNLTGKQVNALDTRLTALGAGRPAMPKGPMPKGMRPPRGR